MAVAGLACLADGWAWIAARISRVPGDLAAGVLGLAVVLWPLAWPEAWNSERRRDAWTPPQEDLFLVEHSPELHEAARRLVDDLEPGAVLFTGWCPLYAYDYVAFVERGRTDLAFYQDYPRAYSFELADSALDCVKEASRTRPVYFTHVVRKVAAAVEMTPVRRGRETLYRVGRPKAPLR